MGGTDQIQGRDIIITNEAVWERYHRVKDDELAARPK
jgi:hypothetical protein